MALSTLDVLCCRITIGDEDPANPMNILHGIEIREVQELEIHESYKKLIGTAKLKFPRGTLFRSTILGSVTREGKDASRLTAEVMQSGALIEKRSAQGVLDANVIKVEQRINIKLGYNGALKTLFDGYVTAYNSDSIFEIECENMAHKLKLKQAPKFETPASGVSVNDILGEKYGVLKDTGFEIHSDSRRFNIQIGKIKITDNFTVADILSEWSKYKVYCFLKYDADSPSSMPTIAIGRPYSSSKAQPVFPHDKAVEMPYKVYFNYHVAHSDLKIVKTNPRFLAVTGKALGSDEKFFEVTVRLNPDYDPKDKNSKEFQIVNATQISRKTHKVTGNTTATGAATKTKVDLSIYTVVSYMSPNMRIDSDKLVEETIEYFRNYNLNGITGSLTLFGDLALTTAVQVELIDDRNPSKNGVYIVEDVTTTFGVNGYRQKITVPYRLNSKSKVIESK